MLETEGEFRVKKWCGTLLAIAFALCGAVSMITQKPYFPQGRGGGSGFVELLGQQAVFAGVAYFGGAIALVGYFFLPYSGRFYRWERLVFSSGLIVVIIGVVLVIWRFFSHR